MCLPLSICLALVSCSVFDEPVPKGRIRVKNDSQDREYNVLTVYGGGANFSLKPGISVIMPKGASDLTFIRVYKDYTREYKVRCPRELDDGISIKLLDVHINKISGSCETYSARKF